VEVVSTTEIMDTTSQPVPTSNAKRRYRTAEEKRRIVEETLAAGVSVAVVARRHAINANQVFHWRKLYRAGLLTDSTPVLAARNRSVRLLPVTVAAESEGELKPFVENPQTPAGSVAGSTAAAAIEIALPKGHVRILGAVDSEVVRAVLDCLLR
jgi:transposase